MRSLEFLPGLDEATSLGAFRPLGAEVEDLGLRLEVAWILADSIRTLVGLGLGEGHQVSRAWLTDDRGGAHPLAEVLELSPAGAALAGAPEHRTVLVFGPVPAEAGRLRLEIQRVETATGVLSPCSPFLDPWQGTDEEMALRAMSWEEPDDPLTPVPLGTAEGCWALEFEHSSAGAWQASTFLDLEGLHPLGAARLRLHRLCRGLTGWCLESRIEGEVEPPCWADQEAWMREAAAPALVLARMEEEGWLPLPEAPSLRLSLKVGEVRVPCQGRSGPWGPLGDRFYDFFPPTEAAPDSLLVEEVVGMPLPEPWTYEFHPRTLDAPPEQARCTAFPAPFRAKVWAEGLLLQEDRMVLAPQLAVVAGTVAEARAARCLLRDAQGNTYESLGSTWAPHPEGKGHVRGLQFPPLHRLVQQVTLEVETVDLLLSPPLELPTGASAESQD